MQRKNERFVERLPLATDRPLVAYGTTIALCLAAFAVRLAVVRVLPIGFPYVSFFPAVILSCFLFGVRPGILAGVICGVLAWYFFIPPPMTFALHVDTAVALAFYAVVVAIDIMLVHLMQRANYHLAVEREKSRALADNRELLFKELQHRVSNNLQVVAALLSLQRRNVDDEKARKALDEASARLALIGKISRALYEPGDSRSGIRAFIETLARDILEASGRRDIAISLDIDDRIALNSEALVPLSLILAETINNAVEHGFAGRERGNIVIALRRSVDGRVEIEVTDDGCGLPDGFSLEKRNSLGLRIASTLAQQLGGSFRMVRGDGGGARALLDMPV